MIAETNVSVELVRGMLLTQLKVEVQLDLDAMSLEWTIYSVRVDDLAGLLEFACLRDHGPEAMRVWASKLSDEMDEIERLVKQQIQMKVER